MTAAPLSSPQPPPQTEGPRMQISCSGWEHVASAPTGRRWYCLLRSPRPPPPMEGSRLQISCEEGGIKPWCVKECTSLGE
uniref:Uncharacterized protein n=1 Tax=Leersia perrieri TaxID=77586 RepID=A0A0D9XHS5_9ORYZ